MKLLKKIPKIDTIYDYFDDGKIRESRRDSVKITGIIPFNNINLKTFTEWKHEVNVCNWLYKEETDYFIKGYLKESNQDVTFVRCKNNGWFSLGWWAGRLADKDTKL